MKILKKKTAINVGYIAKLYIWLLENQRTYFSKENKANSWADMVCFRQIQSDRDHICMPGEVMLVDRNHKGKHTYCICTVSMKKEITTEIPVIEVDRFEKDVWRSGYFVLPIL